MIWQLVRFQWERGWVLVYPIYKLGGPLHHSCNPNSSVLQAALASLERREREASLGASEIVWQLVCGLYINIVVVAQRV